MEELKIQNNIKIDEKDALIIVDMQNDFMPGGALPVEEGNEIVEDVNTIAEIFDQHDGIIVLTQDWHPFNHLSFANSHPGKNPGDEYQTEAIGPILWPVHCVQGSIGADFHKSLKKDIANMIIRKGDDPEVDSYSGFLENDKETETGLSGYLKSLNIKRIFICGLASDYCCFYTAMDGVDFGFETFFIVDLTKGIDLPPGNIANSLESMNKKGVKFVNKDSFL
jgi:nicotinamidase/pyrazinamidase